MQCLFYGRQVYVHWVCGSYWWIHMVLLTPKHFEIQCFGLMFSTASQWEVTKTIFLYFHHYCRYLNQIWSAHMYITVILAGQVSRQILQGNLLRFTQIHHWQFWIVMINGGESAYFQTDLLDFDAFLTILHFVRDSLRCYTWFHPSLDRLGLAVDTWSCCIFPMPNEPVRIQYFPWNLACWFHCICATSMPDFIGISFKQAPWLKFDFLKIVVGRGQEDIGAAKFSSPQKLSTAHTGIKYLLDW